MDADAKKTGLRMIPYGLYVLTARNAKGEIAAATVNWVTQTSFEPPLVAIGLKPDSGSYAALKESGKFSLNMLGKGQKSMAYAFFKPVEVQEDRIQGEPYVDGENGAPLLENAMAAVECSVSSIIEQGDHHIVIGEVTQAHVNTQPDGRPDESILVMKELGDNVFYGG